MKKYVYIAPSTDPISDYQEIIEYAKELQDMADYLHCDVMDGVFVKNKNYDAALVKNINQNSLIPLDVHLMVKEPYAYIDGYLNAGANILTLHYEAFEDKNQLAQAIAKIKERGALAGLSVKPGTNLTQIKEFMYTIDVVLIMSVEPGLSGQSFMPEIFNKIAEFNKFREDNNLSFKIEVDGGVNEDNCKKLIALGADMLVSGSYVFKSQDKKVAIECLRGESIICKVEYKK